MSIEGNASSVSFDDLSFNSYVDDAETSDDIKQRFVRSRSTNDYHGHTKTGERQQQQLAFEVEQMQKQSADVDAMLERHKRGDHVFINSAKLEYEDLCREESLYTDAVTTFRLDKNMCEYNEEIHGHIPLQHTKEHIDNIKTREMYIDENKELIEYMDIYWSEKRKVKELLRQISDNNADIADITAEAEEEKLNHPFEWQLLLNNKIFALDKDNERLNVELNISRAKVRTLITENRNMFKELEKADLALFFDEEVLNEMEDVAESMINEEKVQVYAWIIGRLNTSEIVSNMIFGQFTTEKEPPKNGWIYCGRNITANITESKGLYADSIIAQEEAMEDSKINAEITKTFETMSSSTTEGSGFVDGHDSYHDTPVYPDAAGPYLEPPILKRDGTIGYASPHLRTRAGAGWMNTLRENDTSDENVDEGETGGEGGDDVNLLNTASFGTNTDVPESFAAKNTQTWTELNSFIVDDATMDSMINDKLTVEPAEGISLMKGPHGNKIKMDYRMQYIKGCSFNDVNGKYLEWGRSAMALRYRNPKGWVLLRLSLSEIPELGIKADNCYGALDGEPVLDVMERKTVSAFKDLLDEKKDITEGSMTFKEKFAEISRFGSRIVNYDQTFQLLRNNDLKANVRTAASRAMLLQLLALKSNDEKEKEKERNQGDGASQNSADGSPTVHSTDDNDNIDLQSAYDSETKSAAEMKEEIDVDIETTLSRNTMYQTGSQGLMISKDPKFLAQESELTREATLRIENREKYLAEVNLEAERIHRIFVESHVVDVHNKNFVLISDLLRKIDDLREATINVAEAIGAWTRLCHKKKKGKPTDSVADKSTARPPREYSVAIAVKGVELYPASEPITSGVKKYRRGRQESKVAIDVKYVGLYKQKQAAIDAFSMACSKVPLEKRAFVYGDQPPMYIGLRECGKHYLVRSDGVPSDLPCEQCQSNNFSKPKDIVRASEPDMLPQFLWHGKNYIEKMWADFEFLEKSAPLKKYFPDFRIKGNPLLLDIQSYFESLESIGVGVANPFDTLKGKLEQVQDAVDEATRQPTKPNPYRFMGTPYVENFVKTITKQKSSDYAWLKEEKERIKQESIMRGVIPAPAPPVDEGEFDYARLHSTLENDLFSLNKTSTLNSQSGLNYENDESDKFRVNRALAVLCQSSNVTLSILPDDAKTDRLNRSVLGQNPLKRPTLPSEIKKKIAQGLSYKASEDITTFGPSEESNGVVERYPDAGIKGDFVKTKTDYIYRGAKLSTTQNRPPVANRTDEIWCRTDVGEWKGLSKGRNMRSYEFQERLKEISKALIAERLRMQGVIRKALEIHFADLDKHGGVPYIRTLIAEAAAIRGTALKLDIAQAELYIQKRKMVIKKMTKIKARFHGRKARRRVKEILRQIHWEKEQIRLTEELSYDLARQVVIPLIEGCAQRVGTEFMKMKVKCAVNISGEVYVVSVFKVSRNARRNEVKDLVCEACMSQSSTMVYNPKIHKVPAGVVPNVCGSDVNPNNGETFLAQGTYGSRRAICTCPLVQERERVLFKLYSPVTNETFSHLLTEQEIRENIHFADTVRNITVEERRVKLVGDSFGDLAPIFASRDELRRHVYTKTEMARGLFAASRESSILPLLPKFIPINLLKSVDCLLRVRPEIVKQFYNIDSTRGPITVADIRNDESIKELSNREHWEIFYNLEYTKKQLQHVEHELQVRRDRAQSSSGEYNRLSDLETQAREEHDRACMRFEDIRVQTINVFEKLVDAKKLLVDVISFSKYSLEKFTAEEMNISADWTQSYDGLEDANAWKSLNHQRRLETIVRDIEKVYVERYYKSRETEPVLLNAIEKMNAQHLIQQRDKDSVKDYLPSVGLMKGLHIAMKDTLEGFTKVALCPYYIPYTPICKRRPKHLRKQNINGVYIRDPMVRCQVEYRYLWKLVEKRVIGIKTTNSSLEKGKTNRVVACYYVDPLTGNNLLSLLTDDPLLFEESTMHLDFQFTMSEFSEAIYTGEDKEMLLKPHNVEDFVTRGLDEVHVRINPPVPKSVWIPRKGKDGDRRIRSIDYVKVCQAAGDRLAQMPKSYSKRRKALDDKLYQDSCKIVSSLRLHPYSKRPCLGRLYFDRRLRFIQPIIKRTMWMNNLINQDCVTWNNEFYENLHFLCGNIVHVVIRNVWEKFEFRITMPGLTPMTFLYVLSFKYIVQSFSSKPLLLTSFFSELMTNKFSYDSICHILQHIDVTLPGECRPGGGSVDKFMWRKRLEDNTPQISYVMDESNRFRGPVYRCYRFMSGFYVLCVVYKSAYDDFRIVIREPSDGNYVKDKFTGDDIIIDLDWNQIVCFCLLLPSRRVHTMSIEDALKLMNSCNWEELFRYIFDSITISRDSKEMPITSSVLNMTDLEKHRLIHKQLNTFHSINPDAKWTYLPVVHDKDYVSSRFRLFIKKFERWATARTRGKIQHIPEDIVNRLIRSVDILGHPEYRFGFSCAEEKNSTEKLIRVFEGTWCTPTPLACTKYEDMDTYLDPPILNIPIFSRKNLSYLFFSIFTDDTRDKIYIKVKTSQLNGKKVEKEESILESADMQEADNESRTVEEFIKDQNERKCRKAFIKMNSDSYETHSEKLVVERRKVENMKALVIDEASKIDDLCSRWIEDSKNSTSAYVFNKLPNMMNQFTSFNPSDDLARDMRAILDDVIFAVTDTPRCALCDTTFKNFKKLEFHLNSNSGSHKQSLLKLHEAKLAPKIAKLELEHSYTRRNAHSRNKLIRDRLIRQKALDIMEEKDGTGEYEGFPPITPEAAAEEATEIYRERSEEEYKAVEEAMDKDLEILREKLIKRHNAQENLVTKNAPTCPTIDFYHPVVHAFNKGLECLHDTFRRQSQIHSHKSIHIIDLRPTETVIDRYKLKSKNHFSVRSAGATTASSKSEIIASQQHLRSTYGVKNANPENFRSYNSWVTFKRNISINLEKKSRNGCMALNHIISEPKFGPYDIFSLEFYNPITRTKFSRIFLPPCGLNEIFKYNNDISDSKKKSMEDTTDEDHDDSDSIMTSQSSVITATEVFSIERACALRITSFAILHATASVNAQLTCEKLDDTLEVLENVVENNWKNINGCIDQGEYETFKKNVVDEVPKVSKKEKQRRQSMMMSRANIHEAEKAFGVYVPLDEEEMPTIFHCEFSDDWSHRCKQFLGPSIRRDRTKTLPMFVYTRNEGAYVREDKTGRKIFVDNHVNKRVLEWCKEYTESNGWRTEEKEISEMISRKRNEKICNEESLMSCFEDANCIGDVAVVMRFGERDAKNILDWCKKRYAKEQPIRDALREKEIMRRSHITDCYKLWRNFVFDFARPFVAPLEELCAVGYRRSKNYGSHQYDVDSTATTAKVNPYYGRLLLSEYCRCMDDPKFSQFREDAFLIDSDVALDVEDNFLRFENFDRPENVDAGEVFLKQYDLQKNLRPTVLHVMYAVLIIHCTECQALPGSCKFLGCHLYKTSRCFEIPEDLGTGKHIVEITCREYMLSKGTTAELKSRFITATKIPEEGPDPDLSDEEDEKEANELERLRILEEVTCLKWRDLQAEGAEFRYLNRRICRQEVNKIVPRETYISALPGEHFEDEDQIAPHRQAALDTTVDHMHSMTDGRRKNEVETKSNKILDDGNSTALMEIPLNTFRLICGKFAGPILRDPEMSRHDEYHNYGFQSSIASKIDPYPPEDPNAPDDVDEEESTYPMKKSLFTWFCDRLSISQCVSSKYGQHITGDINFDRLIGEKTVRVDCQNPYFKGSNGDVVIIQILYGRIPGLLSTGPRNGYADAAVRYYNFTRLHELKEGITISVYDTVSNFSRALCFEPNTLKLWTAQLDLGEFEISKLASELLRKATGIFSIVRAGKLFHALTVDPNRVSALSSTHKDRDNTKPGRRKVEADYNDTDDTDTDEDDTDTESDDDDFDNNILWNGRRQLVQEYNSSIGMYELLKAEGKL